MLHIDFETRSKVDLTKTGAHIYASDYSTSALMMSHALDEDRPQLWLPPHLDHTRPSAPRCQLNSKGFPQYICDHIEDGGKISAWNAQFERLIFWYIICPEFNVPEPKLEQFYCTMAQSRANNLPGALDKATRALETEHRKDFRGGALIKLFCIANADGSFNDHVSHPAEWQEFCEYCIKDTYAERSTVRHMRPLTESELRDYYTNEIINDKGLMIDRPLAQAAMHYADEEQDDLLNQIQQLTNGQVLKVRGPKITAWVYDALTDAGEDFERHMHVYKNGELKTTFDKNARQRLLSEPDLPVLIREVVSAADDAQASSTAKFRGMTHRADPEDDRVRGAYIFSGASSSGRYSSRGLQTHNLPRKVLDNMTDVREQMLDGATREQITEVSGMNVMQSLKGLLRPAIRAASGKLFVCGDWDQIEGRVNPWLAMGVSPKVDRYAQAKLDIYADPDRDVYLETASEILHTPITDKEDPRRQGYGKVPELSLGFGGGEGAFMGMAHNYGVNLPRDRVKGIVKQWRRSNPWAQPFWDALFDAAVDAMQHPGTVHPAGRVSYMFQPDFLGGTLWCLLPSGRVLCYPKARCEWGENKFGKMAWQISAMKAAWSPKADETEWPRNGLWPGLLCENVTQAVAADILRECLAYMVLDEEWPVVGHTHDEALLEVPARHAERYETLAKEVMEEGPQWAAGLPLAATIWVGPRFKK